MVLIISASERKPIENNLKEFLSLSIIKRTLVILTFRHNKLLNRFDRKNRIKKKLNFENL